MRKRISFFNQVFKVELFLKILGLLLVRAAQSGIFSHVVYDHVWCKSVIWDNLGGWMLGVWDHVWAVASVISSGVLTL